jgi:hypothetical protein
MTDETLGVLRVSFAGGVLSVMLHDLVALVRGRLLKLLVVELKLLDEVLS